jgi:hypothetical protein
VGALVGAGEVPLAELARAVRADERGAVVEYIGSDE